MTPSKTEHELEELLRAATPMAWKKVSNLGWVEIHSVNEVQPESSPEP